jgi:CRP-like cAMP-binding protein
MIEDETSIDKNIIRLTPKNYSFFGEIGLICSQKRTATVTATMDSEFLLIDHKRFIAISKERPEIAIKLLMEIAIKLAKNLEKTNSDVLKLTTALIYALK